jgi:hypothetical protein
LIICPGFTPFGSRKLLPRHPTKKKDKGQAQDKRI